MIEKRESDPEKSKTQDLSASNGNKPDTAEILRRQGPEFEPPKEDITEKQQNIGQGTGQTTVDPSTDPASKTRDEEAQLKKDAELAQEIARLEQEEKALQDQKLPELEKQLQQMRQNTDQEAQQSNSDADQDEDYIYGMSQ